MSLLQLCTLLLLPLVMWRAFPAEFFPKLRQERGYQHLVFASLTALTLLWSTQAGIKAGLQLHFLLLTTLVLCHGWRIALWLGMVPLAALGLLGKISWQDFGLFWVSQLLVPVLFSYAWFIWTYHALARHLFVYLFVAGFLGAALSIVLSLAVHSGLLWWDGRYDWDTIYQNYLLFAMLIWFPEALLNGAALTLMAIYRPHWLRTFYDREYLGG